MSVPFGRGYGGMDRRRLNEMRDSGPACFPTDALAFDLGDTHSSSATGISGPTGGIGRGSMRGRGFARPPGGDRFPIPRQKSGFGAADAPFNRAPSPPPLAFGDGQASRHSNWGADPPFSSASIPGRQESRQNGFGQSEGASNSCFGGQGSSFGGRDGSSNSGFGGPSRQRVGGFGFREEQSSGGFGEQSRRQESSFGGREGSSSGGFGTGGFGRGSTCKEPTQLSGFAAHDTTLNGGASSGGAFGRGGFDRPSFSASASRTDSGGCGFGNGVISKADYVQPRYGFNFGDIMSGMHETSERKFKDMPPLIKCFYEEHPEVTAMFPEEVAQLRAQLNDISVEDLSPAKEREVAKPIFKFEHAWSGYPEIIAEIEKNGFETPSPVQCQAWPLALLGHDVIAIAQTGSGKTLAFLMPAFVHIDRQPLARDKRGGPSCLVMTPTRELALQIEQEVKKYHYRGIKSVCVYGGGCRRSQVDVCSAGVDIIIATPGRLNDLVFDGIINLSSITFLVLDEADRMLDMGFEPQIKKILMEIRPDRHSMMTSATWPPLVRQLAQKYCTDPFLVVVGSLDLRACKTVQLIIEMVEEDEKREKLLEFINGMTKTDKALIFVGRKSTADHLSSDLIRSGIDCQSLHGDRDQSERERALKELRKGRVRLLIATDVASRGLDIIDITHVINYDFPRNIEEYVHRVGRTGRAGRSGKSITFVCRQDWRQAGELIGILEKNSQEVPEALRHMAERWQHQLQKMRDQPGGFSSRPGGFSSRPSNRERREEDRNQILDPFTMEPIGRRI